MTTANIFDVHLVLGYLVWLLAFATYIWPRLRAIEPVAAQRAIATLHSFRFFGLVFIVPGVVGTLPPTFAEFAAWGDFAAGVLAMIALMVIRIRPLFWVFIIAFNVVGVLDLLGDYYNATRLGVADAPGQLGAMYVIPIIYVPILMITHVAALVLLVRLWRSTADAHLQACNQSEKNGSRAVFERS
jgi:hypothetical protein